MAVMPTPWYGDLRTGFILLYGVGIILLAVLATRVATDDRRSERGTALVTYGYHLFSAVAMLFVIQSVPPAIEGAAICAGAPHPLSVTNGALALVLILDAVAVLTVLAFPEVTLSVGGSSPYTLTAAKGASPQQLLFEFAPHLIMDASMAYMLLRM